MSVTTGTFPGVRIVDMPDLGAVTDTSSMVGERAGSGRFAATALRAYTRVGLTGFVPSIAALRTLAVDMPVVYLQGYATPGDGGEGMFWYNPADTTSPDNGGTIIVGTGGARWYRQWQSSELHLLWFGGSGAADFGAMLRACLAVATALAATMSGVAIILPSCRMAAGSSVTWPYPAVPRFSLTLKGAGLNASVITWTGSNGVTLNMTAAGQSFHIQDMTFATASAGTYTGLLVTQTASDVVYALSDCTRVAFRGADANSYWGTPCETAGVNNVNFTQCNVTGAAPAGTNIGGPIICQGINSQPAIVANFTDCNFTFLDEAITYGDYFQGMSLVGCNIVEVNVGIHQHTGSGATLIGAQLSMNGCQVNCNGAGVLIEGKIGDIVISGANLFYGDIAVNSVPIFLSNTSDVLRLNIVGNNFEGAGASAGTSDAIAIAGRAANVTINSNAIFGFTTGILGVAGSTITYGTINGNTIQGADNTSGGITMSGTTAALTIDANTLAVLGTGVLLGAGTTGCRGVNTFSNCTISVTDLGTANAVT